MTSRIYYTHCQAFKFKRLSPVITKSDTPSLEWVNIFYGYNLEIFLTRGP